MTAQNPLQKGEVLVQVNAGKLLVLYDENGKTKSFPAHETLHGHIEMRLGTDWFVTDRYPEFGIALHMLWDRCDWEIVSVTRLTESGPVEFFPLRRG